MALRQPSRWDAARELHLWNWRATACGAALFVAGISFVRVGPDLFARRLAIFSVLALASITMWWIAEMALRVKEPHHDVQWRSALAVLALLAVAAVLTRAEGVTLGWCLAAGGVLLGTTATGWWAWDRLLRPLDSEQTVVRAKYHANRAEGTASAWDLWQFVSPNAMRRKASVLRPSLAYLTTRQLRAIDPTQYAVRITRTGWKIGLVSRSATVWAFVEGVVLSIGGPRMGKSGALATRILDAPGFVLTTSTRLDLLEATRVKRAEKGRIISFNPTGLGGEPSTMRWSPLAGCRHFPTAQRRADSMIPIRTGEGAYWSQQARQCLGVLFHAAALQGFRLQKVADWIADLGPAAEAEIITALGKATNPRSLIAELKQVTGQNDRTRTSTTASMRPALGWLANESCVEIGDAPVDGDGFIDLTEVIENGRDTIYLIGSPDVKTVTPLISALTAEVAYQLRMVAATKPSGRLDPPAKLALDEMALTCPEIPIDEWTADMGGRNVNIDMSIQSLAQLRQKWGPEAASAILNNVGTLMIFGGTKDDADLRSLGQLVGSRLETLDPDDRRYVAVLDPARIAGLGELECLTLAPGIRPVLGHPLMVWQREEHAQLGRWQRAWIWVQSKRRSSRAPDDASELIDLADHLPAARHE